MLDSVFNSFLAFLAPKGQTRESPGSKGARKTCKWPLSEPLFLGRGCDEALFSEEEGLSVKRGEAIQ